MSFKAILTLSFIGGLITLATQLYTIPQMLFLLGVGVVFFTVFFVAFFLKARYNQHRLGLICLDSLYQTARMGQYKDQMHRHVEERQQS